MARREFSQIAWDATIEDDCRHLVRLAIREDLDRGHDWTTVALIPPDGQGAASLVIRQGGVVAGLKAVPVVLEEMEAQLRWTTEITDGVVVGPGAIAGTLTGHVRDLLVAERLILNLLGRLSGIATLTQKYVMRIAGTKSRIYDTRKTTPGYRRLEKYAVRCGGGHNHRRGLDDAVLIKDNHLAFGRQAGAQGGYSPADAIVAARQFLLATLPEPQAAEMIVEAEVDTLDQLAEILPVKPDIVLLDNMTPAQLAEAVCARDAVAPDVQLEASGGVSLETVKAIAESGVERISVGALTHAAPWLDIGLDWSDPDPNPSA